MTSYNKEQKEFLKIFSKSFYDKILKESLVSFKHSIKRTDAEKIIVKAYDNLLNYNYSISNPQEYIYLLKNKYVSRIIPVFSIEDEAIYFFLCKQLEDDITTERVEGTFGGWRIGNSIKALEDEELAYVINSYDPYLWIKNWKEFQKYIYTNLIKYDYKFALKLDIANFYDSIDINILCKKLYKKCKKSKYSYIELIIYLLKYWNKKYSCYNENNVGIPQNEFGDQSRLLANFYLNDYDKIMFEVCENRGCKYSRFADDQIILFDNEEDINEIMLVCNEELRKIGLNLNASKVEKFTNEELKIYYLFEILDMLENQNYDEACDKYFSLLNSGNKLRSDTFIRRCLTKGLNNFNIKNREKLVSMVMDDDFILGCGTNHLNSIYKNLDKEEKALFVAKLNKLYYLIKFNGFRYIVLNFYKKNKMNELFNRCCKEMM